MDKRTFYVLDNEGHVTETYTASRKRIFHGSTGDYWVLDDVEGTLMYRFFPITADIVDSAGWVDPDKPFTDKVLQGAEEEFDFFLKHGYHKPKTR